jgi:CheY-like chemotaxis protein
MNQKNFREERLMTMTDIRAVRETLAAEQRSQRVILLVDDDEDEHDIFLSALKSAEEDCTLISAISSDDALRILRNLIPDVIFLDINMPRITGIKCLEEIKKINKLSGVPVYIYSTGINSKEGQKAILLGAKDYIIKPNSINELGSVLREILS